tara:strand:- start:1394 stop:1801 length:408 start_codon:yes stop_codon:yes gene_type:complete
MEEQEDIFRGLGIEVTLKSEEDFLKVRETLTRMGISSRKDKKLYQSCHILHKRGRYAIMHFKELFEMDGLESNISDEDIGRRNAISNLLEEWKLLDIIEEIEEDEPISDVRKIKILSHKDKDDWELIPKYHIGNS